MFVETGGLGLHEITWHIHLSREEVLSVYTHFQPSPIFESLISEMETAEETRQEHPEVEKNQEFNHLLTNTY